MRCGKCGGENNDGAKFCAYCGSPLETERASENRRMDSTDIQRRPNVPPDSTKKRKKWPWLLCAAVLVIAAAAGGVFVFLENRQEKQYEALLDSGNRYIEELDYEKAEDSYLQAISIDPKQKEPYLKLIDIYIAQEEYDQAAETAEKARDSVPAEDKQEFEEILENWENITDYTWVVEPEIEADDINYVCGAPFERGENGWTVENDRNGQFITNYAVVRTGNRTGFIDFSGNISWADDSDYQTQRTANGAYYINNGLLSGAAEGSIGGGHWYYYCDGLYDAYIWDSSVTPQFDNPVPIPQTDSAYSPSSSSGNMSEWFEQHTQGYMIYTDGRLLENNIYEECGAYREGLMAVCVDGKWGYVDREGNEVIAPEYDSSWTFTNVVTGTERNYCYAASDGFIPLTKDGKWELRTVDGTTVIPAGIFEAIRPVYDGRCWVKKDGRWGVIQIE